MTRKNDNTSQGGEPGGKSVNGSHLDTQSSDISADEIRESGRELIPVPDSLWKETTFLHASLLAEGI